MKDPKPAPPASADDPQEWEPYAGPDGDLIQEDPETW